MLDLPSYIYVLFIAATLVALFFLYLGTNRSKTILIIVLGWLIVQGLIAWRGFYYIPRIEPQHFLFLILPPLMTVVIISFTPLAIGFREVCNPESLTLLHTARLGVECVLFFLFVRGMVPRLMTFEGGNLDILAGLTAPLVAYLGYHKKTLSTRVLLAWNFICIGLLFNIVIRAVLSAPFSFQKFGFDRPNLAVFYFPFIWLPGFIVPAVLFSHLITIRKLLTVNSVSPSS